MIDIHYTQILDISLPLTNKTIIYPGNPPVNITTRKSASGTSISSDVSMGIHTGTHIDSPAHMSEDGQGLESTPLETFIGPCRVLDVTSSVGVISKSDLEKQAIQKGERILFKTTNSARGYEIFYDDYVYLSGEGAQYLAEKEISLVGIDYLSIKQRGSKDNTPHTHLLSKNIPIIEGIDLSQVEPGEYHLIALPLKFVGIDGSPARVVLLK